MSEKFIINGAKVLKGEIEVRGSKNTALPILAATILTDRPCIIENLPLIEDVKRMIKILEIIGAKIEWLDERKIKIQCREVDCKKVPNEEIGHFRGSVLLWGSLLARFNSFKTVAPGGCKIGNRPIDTHLDAFSQMGVKIEKEGQFYNFKKLLKNKKNNYEVVLDEFSVTATENILLFASSLEAKTIIEIADQDYQVQELVNVLNRMGAKIKYRDVHSFEIEGSKKLKGFNYRLIGDPIEAGTFVIMTLASKGDVIIKNVETQYLKLFFKKIKDGGARIDFLDNKIIRVRYSSPLVINKIQTLPYPGIPTDLQCDFGVLATQTKGSTLIHDPLYEGRLKYLEELNKMGADIIFCDPHRAIINGPTPLRGTEIISPDIRSGAALVIAGIIAQGTTVINDVYQIDRGYERLEERLKKIGADIKRISG